MHWITYPFVALYNLVAWFYVSAFAFSSSPTSDLILDILIVVFALCPALYVSAKFLFASPNRVRGFAESPILLWWLLFFCGIEIALHLLKAPLILKLVVVVLAILLIPDWSSPTAS